jgi:hypothetical protein
MATATRSKGKTAADESGEHLEARYGVEQPYTVTLRLRGVTPFLFNKFADLEAYAEARVAPKRKPREAEVLDYESMVWRDDNGSLSLPVQNVIASLVGAARYFKSPIASSGGATTTLREALIPANEMASFDVSAWDCVDFRLARNGDMKRSPKPTWRPRLEKGWLVTADIGVVLPELYGPTKLLEIIQRAGTTSGLGDGRKIGFGRFVSDGMEIADGLPW